MAKKTSAPTHGDENLRYFSERLRSALEAMHMNPLTMVEAPAGYGKTVAVKTFLAKIPATTVMTTAAESSPENFWPDFCRGIAHDIPEAGEAGAALLRLGLPRDYTQTRTALELLRQVRFSRQTFLVFDDCHNLPRAFIDFCESLAAESLPGLHLVCITRHARASDRGFSRPQSSPSRMDRNLFALTPPEICEFYALHGISLSQEAARALYDGTEGWISALYLSLLLHKEDGGASSVPADIAARMKETIHRTVYAPLSAEAKELLLTLAPLERFTASLASRLFGRDTAALLDELTGKNAFVVFDLKSGAYSPHAIFRQFLLDLFTDDAILPPERRRNIHRACGDALMDAREIAPAMEAWHQAGDFERALAALEKDMSRNLVTERATLYAAMFKDCPEEILERRLGAAFKYAIALFSLGDFPAFGAQMAWLAKRCAALPPGAEGDRWRGELHVLSALAAFNDIEAMSAHHKKALALLGGPTSLYGADSHWTLGSPSSLFMFYRESGKLRETLRLMRECMPPYYQLARHHGAGAEFLMEAEALFNAGEFAKAEDLCRSGLGMADRHNQLGNVFCALFLRMRRALLHGDAEALFGRGATPGLLADMRGLIARSRDYFLLHTADVCEGWLYAVLGLYDKIPHWLRVTLGEDSPLYAFAKGSYYLVHGRALLLAGEYDAAIKQFGGMVRGGAFAKNLLFSVYAHIYLAAALHKKHKGHEAASALKTALDAALPDALYMPFAENHDQIGPLLAKALFGKEDAEALARITALAERVNAGREAIVREEHAAKRLALLSERELEVARLVGKGLANQEAAEMLHIQESTVRAHMTRIFKKLGVQDRSGLRKFLQNFPLNNTS